MKVIFEKNKFISAITPALGFVSGKNTLPAIEGINLICEAPGKCTVTAYDLEKGFRSYCECEVEEEGNYIINGQKLSQRIRALPGDFVTVEVNSKNIVSISAGTRKFELHAIDGRDFPALPDLEGERGFEIPQSTLAKMLRQTGFAIAQNNMRPELNGSYFVTDGSTLTVVSCDGNKLALSEQKIDVKDYRHDNADFEAKFIVPGKTLTELLKIMEDTDEPMRVKLTQKNVIFTVDRFNFFSRLIDSEYIDYNRFIPKNSKIFVNLDAESFTDALESSMLVAEDHTLGQAKSPLKCNFEGNQLTVSCTSVSGRVSDKIFTEKIGDDIEIGFNCRYRLDAMKSCTADRVKLSLSGPLMSMIIEPAEADENERFLFLVLPVKMKD